MAPKPHDDQDVIAERIAEGLRSRAPEANRKGWYMKLADAVKQHPDTIRNWIYGDSAPSGPALLLLFEELGEGFELEVRGYLPGGDGAGQAQFAEITEHADAIKRLAEGSES